MDPLELRLRLQLASMNQQQLGIGSMQQFQQFPQFLTTLQHQLASLHPHLFPISDSPRLSSSSPMSHSNSPSPLPHPLNHLSPILKTESYSPSPSPESTHYSPSPSPSPPTTLPWSHFSQFSLPGLPPIQEAPMDLSTQSRTTMKSGTTPCHQDSYSPSPSNLSDFMPIHSSSVGQTPSPPPEYSCHDCGKHYSSSSNLARHRQTHKNTSDDTKRSCPHCDKVYVSTAAFSMHVRTHTEGCKCPFCGKSFSRPWLLQGHIRTHTGEKPFSCNVCHKGFADKSNLRAHTQTHSGEKPFCCERCGKSFALKSYLSKHEESSCIKQSKRTEGKHGKSDIIASSPYLVNLLTNPLFSQ